MSRTYLVAGGAGFIGSNFVRLILDREPASRVINLDALTYAGVMATVDELDQWEQHTFVHGDIRDRALVDSLVEEASIVVNFAAESHVDRSIEGPTVFSETNVVGTAVLLESARQIGVDRFIQVSTDEVYGSVPEGSASESATLNPSSPYSASKAGSDLLALSYTHTFDLPVVVTRCTNNYGPYQFPEKLIPLFVTRLIEGETVPVYGDGRNERDWLYVTDHCAAIRLLADSGDVGEVYNIGADAQLANIDLTKRLVELLGRDTSHIEFIADRPGHDLRYAVDSTKIRSLGWRPAHDFESGIAETIAWYRDRRDWWEPLLQ